MKNEILIYEDDDNVIEVQLDSHNETLWLSQKKIAEIFGRDVRAVNEHLINIYI